MLVRAIKNPKLILDYLEGTGRTWLYHNAPFLIRLHILEQFHERLYLAEVCVKNGSCLSCGCKMYDLLFCTKPCSLSEVSDLEVRQMLANRKTICYGPLLSKKEWNNLKRKY